MMPLGQSKKSRAFLYAVVLHLLVVIALVARSGTKSAPIVSSAPAIKIVKAHVVDQAVLEAEVKRLKDAVAAKQREAEKKLADAAKKKQVEEKRIAEVKRKKQARIEKKKKDVELAERREKEVREQERAKQKSREEKIEQQRVADERRKLANEKVREESENTARELRESIESEERELAAAEQARAEETEISRYLAAVRARVASVFIYPDMANGLNCTLYVRMIPSGEVVEARVTESSGNATFDRQAENAVRKAAPLPVPSDPRLFKRMREIKFVFDPEQ